MNKFLEARDRRELDRQRAKDVKLKREREQEDDELSGTEKFVTAAYKAQQAKLAELEKQEREREERDKAKGMADFHRQLLDTTEATHDAVVEATKSKSSLKVVRDVEQDEESAHMAERRRMAEEANRAAGYEKVKVSEDGQVVDDKQLLRGGLNVVKKPGSTAAPSSMRNPPPPGGVRGPRPKGVRSRAGETEEIMRQIRERDRAQQQQAHQARQTIEEQVKSRKTESDIANARQRYLARKQAAARANLPHKPNI